MSKSADAFRTISEVAEWLGVQTHVLRFWESKFNQVKPVKRAGGRRYYRPADMRLIGGIKKLLHEDGMTIKAAQALLRDKGIAHVAALSQPLEDAAAAPVAPASVDGTPPQDSGTQDSGTQDKAPQDEAPQDKAPQDAGPPPAIDAPLILDTPTAPPQDASPAPDTPAETAPATGQGINPTPETPDGADSPEPGPQLLPSEAQDTAAEAPPAPRADATDAGDTTGGETDAAPPPPASDPQNILPSFIRARQAPRPKPTIIAIGPLPQETQMPSGPATLSSALKLTQIPQGAAPQITALLQDLAALRDRMATNDAQNRKD